MALWPVLVILENTEPLCTGPKESKSSGIPHPWREKLLSRWGLLPSRPQVTVAISSRAEVRPAAGWLDRRASSKRMSSVIHPPLFHAASVPCGTPLTTYHLLFTFCRCVIIWCVGRTPTPDPIRATAATWRPNARVPRPLASIIN